MTSDDVLYSRTPRERRYAARSAAAPVIRERRKSPRPRRALTPAP